MLDILNRFRIHAVGVLLTAGIWSGLTASVSSAAESPITAVAFAPDGQSVAVGSQAGVVIRSWPDLTQLKTFDTALINVHDLAFSPGGTFLAVAGGTPSDKGQVEVFTWPEGESLYVCSGHEDLVSSVAWNGDSSFATASLDHEIVIWDTQTHEPVQRLKGHSRGVLSVCYLADPQILVSGGLDQNLRVWNTQTEKIERTLNNHTREVHQLSLRPGNEGLPMIASISDDRTVRLWQPTIGRMVRFAQLDSAPLSVDWLTDGSRVVVSAADGHLRLIDPDTVEISQDVAGVDGWAYAVAVHPTDGSVLIGGRNGQLKRIIPKSST